MTRNQLGASTALALALSLGTSTAYAQVGEVAQPGSDPAAQDQQVAGAGAVGPQSAAGEVQEVIVTATRRETVLQRTPIAVSAFNQTALDRQQVTDVTDLARFVPSLQFNEQGDQSAIVLTLRGIGNDTAYTEVADPEVAIYIDGIYSPRAQGASTLFYDVERVEVLRGPQGTLFGRNATVGALSIVSAKPTLDKMYGYVDAVAGNYDRFGVRGALNLPVNDTLGFRLAFVTEQNDGYVDFQAPVVVPNEDRGAFVTSGKRYFSRDQHSVGLSGG